MTEAKRVPGWAVLLAVVVFVAAVAVVIVLGPRRS
jgi:hypothetical protein